MTAEEGLAVHSGGPARVLLETLHHGGQVFGGYTMQVQVDCTQRLDRQPHGGWLGGRTSWEAPGVIQAAAASVRPRRNTSKAPRTAPYPG
jgi:hypothetical protein